MITFFPLDIRHYNSNMMYIYKRPYVHFPTIFLRQNCDHMCIIKIVFNPLPMKIFWKKLLCIFSFWKIKKVLCILLKSVFCINIYVDPLMFSAENWNEHAISVRYSVEGIFFSRGLQNKSNQSTILSIKFYSFVTHIMNLKIWHEVWGARSLSCWCWVILSF